MTYIPHQSPLVASKLAIKSNLGELIPYDPITNSIIPNYTPMDVEAPITSVTFASPLIACVVTLEHELQQLQADIASIQA